MQGYQTYDEMQQQRDQSGDPWPPVRARGSRLEPGELEEIELTADRGEPTTVDQVLGLIETVRALARRCAVRFQEAQELRARLAEVEANPPVRVDMTALHEAKQAREEVTRLREEWDRLVVERNDLRAAIDDQQRRNVYTASLLKHRVQELQAIESIVMTPRVTEAMEAPHNADSPMAFVVLAVREVRDIVHQAHGQMVYQEAGRQESMGMDATLQELQRFEPAPLTDGDAPPLNSGTSPGRRDESTARARRVKQGSNRKGRIQLSDRNMTSRTVREALRDVPPGGVVLLAVSQPPPSAPGERRGLGVPLVMPYVALYGGGTWSVMTSRPNVRALPRGVSLDNLMGWLGRGDRKVVRISTVTTVKDLYVDNAATEGNRKGST